MSKARDLADYADNIDAPKNLLINGGFDIWQRGTSQTTGGYNSDDRWYNTHLGSTKTHGWGWFSTGTTQVVGNPKYYSRTDVSSVAGAGNYVAKSQFIEDVRRVSGEKVTVTFWARADVSKNIAVEMAQSFGTGGSPSSSVLITPQTVSLTTSFVKHSLTFDVPSVSGKTLGTNGNSHLALNFWFEAGSTFNARTNSLGQQSGTFDIARVSVCKGDVTALDDPFEERSYGEELALCERYFTAVTVHAQAPVSGFMYVPWYIQTTMRAMPTLTVPVAGTNAGAIPTVDGITNNRGGFFQINATPNGGGVSNRGYHLDAEL